MDQLDRKYLKTWAIAVMVLWIASSFWKPAPRRRPTAKLEILAYYENGTGGNLPNSLSSLISNIKRISYLSPFWYSVGANGAISVGERTPDDGSFDQVVNLARRNGVKIVPLVSNRRTPVGSETDFLRDPALRSKVVLELYHIAKGRGWDGLNIAFELIPASLKTQFVNFTEDLATKLKSDGMMLFVSVFPPKEMPAAVVGGYDYRQLAIRCDRLVLQMYDRHWAGTEPGPIAPLPWVESNLQYLTRIIVPSKIIMAVGLYGYDWPGESRLGKPEYISARQALERAAGRGIAIKWDGISREPYYSYVENQIDREVYFGSGQTAADRATVARQYGLSGIAIWRLGFEEPSFWGELEKAVSI
ncbi:MAG TPA: hypothetical protein GXX40_01050 [Firmicutes bacterium]|nr:hypothetical protein [Bacillota bacterium]